LERSVYEIKISQTIHADFFKNLHYYKELDNGSKLNLIYGGSTDQQRSGVAVYGFENNKYLAG